VRQTLHPLRTNLGFQVNPSVKSLLIETNTNLPEHRKMVRDLEDLGFKFSAEQVSRSIRKSGTFEGVAEYVFRR